MNKPYLLDNEEVTAEELIHAAAKLDHSYACSWMRQTSVAAIILRSHGHSVEKNCFFLWSQSSGHQDGAR